MITTINVEGDRESRWNVEVSYINSGLTETEARAIHKKVADACAEDYVGTERVHVWHYASKIKWGCASKEGATRIYKAACQATGEASGLISSERELVIADRLWAEFVNDGQSIIDKAKWLESEVIRLSPEDEDEDE